MVDLTEDLEIWTLHKHREGQGKVYKCSASRTRQNHLYNDPSSARLMPVYISIATHIIYLYFLTQPDFLYLLYLHLLYFNILLFIFIFLRQHTYIWYTFLRIHYIHYCNKWNIFYFPERMEFSIHVFCVAWWWLFEPEQVACIRFKKPSVGCDCVINEWTYTFVSTHLLGCSVLKVYCCFCFTSFYLGNSLGWHRFRYLSLRRFVMVQPVLRYITFGENYLQRHTLLMYSIYINHIQCWIKVRARSAAPIYKVRLDVTGMTRNMVLLNSRFHTRNNFSESYPHLTYVTHMRRCLP
jgi:hypothetical protein